MEKALNIQRRNFLTAGATVIAAAATEQAAAHDVDASNTDSQSTTKLSTGQLTAIASQSVLDVGDIGTPVLIESVELLKSPSDYLVRVRSRDGATGIAAGS